MNPKMYNDIAYDFIINKRKISEIVFSEKSRIYSYSIPLPPKKISQVQFFLKNKIEFKNIFELIKLIVSEIKNIFKKHSNVIIKRKFIKKS